MILSAQSIKARKILDPLSLRSESHGVTYGLGPAGYDLRLDSPDIMINPGEFILASALERFEMPDDILGVVHDKSSLARRGVSVFNTVIEPGWRGFLTLEIVNHGKDAVVLKEGQGIAQVIFHVLDVPSLIPYQGKYQNQERGPQKAR